MRLRRTEKALRETKAKGNPIIHETMGMFKRGTLHSGSRRGPLVKGRSQAIAIALNAARKGR